MAEARSTWWAPRVRTLVGGLFVLVVGLPVLLVGVERLLDNALIVETEQALLTEAVVVGEVYRVGVDPEGAARPLSPPAKDEGRYAPILPRLDLSSSPVLMPATRRGESTTSTAGITRLLERAMVRNLSGLRVLDAEGRVVASSSRVVGYRLDHLPEVEAALGGGYRPVLRRRFSDEPPPPLSSLSRAADLRVSLAIPVFRDPRGRLGGPGEVLGVVYASRTPLDPTRALWAWRDKLLWPFGLSVLVTLAAVVFLSVTLSRPLSRLRRHAEQVAEGAPAGGYRVGRVAPLEVHVLAAALERMSEQLEARADYIREFAANAAHELKTPLTSLRGAAELLLDAEGAIDPARRRRFLENIERDAVRMDDLVQRILDLARIEADRPAREAVDLPAWLDGVAERYRRRGQVVRVDFQAQARALDAVPEQLDSLLVNLLDNAARHGGGEPVDVTVRDAGGGIDLEVRDHGPRLPPGHLDRVFERFYTTERGSGGTGLGLAIVRAVAEAHGGTVRAEAKARGAAFTVWWPLRRIRAPRSP